MFAQVHAKVVVVPLRRRFAHCFSFVPALLLFPSFWDASEDITTVRSLIDQQLPLPGLPLPAGSVHPLASLHLPYLSRCHILSDYLPAEIHESLINIIPPSSTGLIVRCIIP